MIYFRDNNGDEQLIAGIAGAGQTITQSITNGVTDKAPSSNAVYDALAPVDITSQISYTSANYTPTTNETRVFKLGKLVICCLKGTLLTNAGYVTLATGLPKPESTNQVINFTFSVDSGSGIGAGSGYVDGVRQLRSRFSQYSGEFAANFSYIAAE